MMKNATGFEKAVHTVILSDIHLTTEELPHPKDPLWRRFKQRDFFIDDTFTVFLRRLEDMTASDGSPVELILAGDIFDFDGVTKLPVNPNYNVSWLEKKRGLSTEEPKSLFKMTKIIEDHSRFFNALSRFVAAGNRLVFIIGNHDIELHWTSVQELIIEAIAGQEVHARARIRFNQWFYISNGDTLIEHGNQHDSHSNCQNPVNPLIKGLRGERVRLPFGCLANRLMLNGMGYFNPHSERSYMMTTVQYIKFAVQYLIRREPLLIWTWIWGATATVLFTFKESFPPEVKDPLKVEDVVEDIAAHANATPKIVRQMKEVHAPPMFMDPLSVARELWLDRAFLVLFGAFLAFEAIMALNIFSKVSYWWMLGIFALFLPFFLFYFRSIKSKIVVNVKYYERAVTLGARICGVSRVVFGHTHEFTHTNFDTIEYLNSGTWSPAFDDIACTIPSCPKTFVWIRPESTSSTTPTVTTTPATRIANVFEWTPDEDIRLLC